MPNCTVRSPSPGHPSSSCSARRALEVLSLAALMGAGCAHGTAAPKQGPAPAVTHFEMEPIKISAVSGPEGLHIESFDAADLFDQGGKALSEKRHADAIAAYERLLREFPDTRYTRAALYNCGLAYQSQKDWSNAIARFKSLAETHADSSDAKDALFQLGATYAEVGNWPSSIEVLVRVLERKDLSADDRLEALGRRGYAQLQLGDLDAAERTFRSALGFFKQIETEERLETDFYLALAHYHLGQISHSRFRAIKLRLPDVQMSADLDEKARLLLTAQRQYIDTIKLGNPEWASASGFQIASLYEELYDAFAHAPVPPELTRPDAKEKRELYFEELRKKIRVLLEKSVRTHEANLLMMERLGVRNEWRDRSKLAYAKIQKLLDPSFRPDPSDLASAGSADRTAQPVTPPPVPTPPTGARPSDPGADPAGGADAASGLPSGADEPAREQKRRKPPAEGPIRQIL